MHEESSHDPKASIEAGVEVTDMNARIIAIAGAVLAASIVFSVVVCIFIVRGMDRRGPMNPTPGSPLTVEMRTPPTGPLLQPDPAADKEKILAEAQAKLSHFGMLDENPAAAKAHIPIDLALDLVAEGKVPYRQKPTSALLTGQQLAPATEPLASPAPPAAAAPAPVAPTPAPAPAQVSQ